MLETHGYKKLNFQHYSETKMSTIIEFESTREIKKLLKKPAKSKFRKGFISREFLTLM